MRSPFKAQRGFTLMELMVSITVLGVLLGLAIPSFREIIRNNRTTTLTNEFVGSLNYARSEALKRSNAVTTCSSTDGATCAASNSWNTGWIVFVDVNANGNLDGADEMLQQMPATTTGFALDSTVRTFVRYASTGMSSGAETFNLVPPYCTGDHARQIAISTTGRVASTVVACP